MASFDYLAIAYQYGINSDSKAKKLFQDAMNITRKLVGNNVPQNTLEREFPKELMDNYQDLLQSETSGKANKRRESVNESKETIMKNRTKIREFLEGDLELDALVDGYDLEEEESYSQALINPRTVKGKKRKEYAIEGGGENKGDLNDDVTNGYGSSYGDFDKPNGYNSTDDKEIIARADPFAIETQDSVGNGEV